jgi:hypothetical protein
MYGMKEYLDKQYKFTQDTYIGNQLPNDKKLELNHGIFEAPMLGNKWGYKDMSKRGSFVKLFEGQRIELRQGTVIKFGDEKIF